MADITMCQGVDCPIKKTCYRYTANSDANWQCQFAVALYDKKKKKCKEYLQRVPVK